jgi:hypothetical protein
MGPEKLIVLAGAESATKHSSTKEVLQDDDVVLPVVSETVMSSVKSLNVIVPAMASGRTDRNSESKTQAQTVILLDIWGLPITKRHRAKDATA